MMTQALAAWWNGRHWGLKIPCWVTGVWVRVPPRPSSTHFPKFNKSALLFHRLRGGMDDRRHSDNLFVRNRLLARSHHFAERRGQAEHLVVVAVPEIAFDRRRVLEAFLLE